MPDIADFHRLVYAWFGVGLIAFVALRFATARYGRHGRSAWARLSTAGSAGW